MIYTKEVENMCPVAKGAKHEPAPIPEEGKWVHSKKIEDISGFTHGVGWCAPQQGACKLSLNVKNGIIEEALVETIGCSGMTHSASNTELVKHPRRLRSGRLRQVAQKLRVIMSHHTADRRPRCMDAIRLK